MVNKDRLVQLFLEFLNTNSPSRSERAMADLVTPILRDLGFDVREDGAAAEIGGDTGNIIARKQGCASDGLRILLSSHLDTVETTRGLVPIFTDDGSIVTSGETILGADDKAGVAAILEALRVVQEESISFRGIQVVFDVAEEVGLLGAKQLNRDELQADLAYIFDTEQPVASIVTSAPSYNNIKFTITGKAAHAGISPENGVNAIRAASEGIARMRLSRIDEETTANVGVIHGGKARNIVPDRVEVLAEARSRDEKKLQAQTEHMTQAMREAASEMGASVDVEVRREYNSFRWTAEDPVVKLAVRAARAVGEEPRLVAAGGGSDANIFNACGLPAVLIGVGFERCHSPDERIAIDDLVKCAEFIVELIRGSVEGHC